MQESSVANHPEIGRRLDPEWVDLDIIKKWKFKCLSAHGPRCIHPMKIQLTQPAWLVDFERQCLVPAITGSNLVALTYTWGNAPFSYEHFTDRAKLHEPDVLLSSEIAEKLAPIARHAIRLTSLIGERYLWIDRLYIDHTNREAMEQQLRLMGAIYASATITVVALDTDSREGILGLKGISPPRNLKQQIFPFREAQLLFRSTSQDTLQTAQPYHDRGWTYQEYQMSQRKNLFCRGKVHWQCQCSAWHED